MNIQTFANRIVPSKRIKQSRDLRIDISFYPVLIAVLVIPAAYSEVSSNYNKTDFILWILIKIFSWSAASFYAGYFIKFAGKTTKLTGDSVISCIKTDLNKTDNVR